MRYLTITALGLLLATSCSTPQVVSIGPSKPNASRVAYIYEDKVVIVTKREFTREQYAQMVASTEANKQQ
jgi:hypothetical protein